jgi:hypothetical protein
MQNITAFLEQADAAHEAEVYHGADDATDRVLVYLASDNERVKEAFAGYLMEHHNMSVARVRTGDIIVHAKNRGETKRALRPLTAIASSVRSLFTPHSRTEYLKQTKDGVLALAVDWYSLSLANVLFTWRRDTAMTSTFARVSLHLAQVLSFYGTSLQTVMLCLPLQQSAEKMSGNPESLNLKLNVSDISPSSSSSGATRMFQLTYSNGMPRWGVQ